MQEYKQLVSAGGFRYSAVIVFGEAGCVFTECSVANASQHSTSS